MAANSTRPPRAARLPRHTASRTIASSDAPTRRRGSQKPKPSASRTKATGLARPSEGARAARISDEAVRRATGRDWSEWLAFLDERGAAELTHAPIARMAGEFGAGDWWAQMIAVTYERARGLRDVHQKPDGYSASCSRTIRVDAEAAYQAWANTRKRSGWLPAPVTIRSAVPDRRLRLVWPVGDRDTAVEVSFWPKPGGRVQVTVQHSKLQDRAAHGRMKTFWAHRLDALRARLEAGRSRAS